MKKLLLCGAVLLGSLFSANAQGTCATALTIPVIGGTISAPAVTGTYPTGGTICTFPDAELAVASRRATWYKYTAASSGVLTIDAAIAPNNPGTADTRLRILGGTCGNFTCLAQNDDANFAGDDYRSRISNFTVTAGTTYYIVWDNRWSATAFQFAVTFTAQSCFAPTNFAITTGTLTTSGATIQWTAPTAGTPDGYQLEYGPVGFTQGTGTTLNPTTTSAAISGLNSGTIYGFYVRTKCGNDYSTWAGPYTFSTLYTPATLPYTQNFDNIANRLDGFSIAATGDWNTTSGTADVPAQSGTGFAFTNTALTAVNKWMFSREISLQANVPVNISLYTWYLGETTDIASLAVTVGASATTAAQTTTLATFTSPGGTSFAQRTTSFTPTTTGIYVFGFNNNSGPASGAWSLLVDSISFTAGTAGTNDFLSSKLSVFPNPATNVVNIKNADNILVTGVQVIDINGRTVKSVKYDGVTEAQINVSDLAAGMYIMNISSDNGTITKKIVKN